MGQDVICGITFVDAGSTDTPKDPTVEFLIETRERLLDGAHPLGDPKTSRAAQDRLAEIDARLGLAQRMGHYTPPEPWTPDRVAREQLASEFPRGNPADTPFSPLLSQKVQSELDAMSRLNAREQADRVAATAADFENRTSTMSLLHALFQRDTGTYPTGAQIVEKLLAQAGPAISHLGIVNLTDPGRLFAAPLG